MDGEQSDALPPGWAWARVDKLAKITGGITKNAGRSRFTQTVPYLRVANVLDGELCTRDLRMIGVGDSELHRARLRTGDLLFVEGNGSLGQIGRVALWTGEIEVCVHQNHLIKARFHDERMAAWAMRWFQSPSGRQLIERVASSTSGLHTLSLSKISGLMVPIAPVTEQQRVLSEIHFLMEEASNAEAAVGRARELAGAYRASLLHAACIGALTADWRAANPHPKEDGPALLRRILADRRMAWERARQCHSTARGQPLKSDSWKARYAEPVEPPRDNVDDLPKGWCWATLDQLTTLITSGSRAWAPYYGRGTGTFIMAANVRPGRFSAVPRQLVGPPFDDPERLRTMAERNDVLITIVGANTGQTCAVQFDPVDHYVCQSVALLRPVLGKLSTWVELCLISETNGQAQFRQSMYGAGRPHLSFDQLRMTRIPLPPADEISAILRNVSDTVDSNGDNDNGDWSSFRQSILQAAFNGQLVPQDPADEPVDALLTRLRAGADLAPLPRARRSRRKVTA